MKKFIYTKKVIVAAMILTIALFVFPLSSFGGGALVIRHEGPIDGLSFDFKDPLPLNLGGMTVSVVSVDVFASGREITVITPKGQYIYHAKLGSGGDGEIYAYTKNFGSDFPLVFIFDTARLFERFQIDGDIPQTPEEVPGVIVPDDVNLFFRVKDADAILLDDEGNPYPAGEPFNLMFKIKRGELKFLHIW